MVQYIKFFFIIFIVINMGSCGAVRQFEQWEDTRQRATGDSGDLRFEDEFIEVTFSREGEKEVRFHMRNKTGGRITIRWDGVSCKLPSGSVMAVIHGGDGAITIIPAGSEISDSIAPVVRIPYLADEDRWKDADGSFDFQQEFAIDMPLEIENLGGRKGYTFNFDLD